MKKHFFLWLTIAIPCFGTGQSLPVNKGHLKSLARTMAGVFSSEQQSLQDSDYYHITLRMIPFHPEWPDGYWLYVEQAMAAMQEKPYRQRVYHLYLQDDTTIVSKVYELKSPARYTGVWKGDKLLAEISADSLVDRQGCAIYLHRLPEGLYSGSTPDKQCLSTLRGATYATSEVVIYPKKIVSWDRGWDASDKQVWGAVKGGYIFEKIRRPVRQ